MATTHRLSSGAQPLPSQKHDERTSYATMLVLIILVSLAALIYGYSTSDNDTIDSMTLAETTPATDGSTSSMTGTALTPSITTPGAPDTTTTESTNVPTDGIR